MDGVCPSFSDLINKNGLIFSQKKRTSEAVQFSAPLTFLIDLCNECCASDSQTRWF
jgi:hypothetical protein